MHSEALTKSRKRSFYDLQSFWRLPVILIIFLVLALGTTWLSHVFGENFLQGDKFTGDGASWGSASDWFSGVVGVSIGLAGSSIAIWLAYRVEKLTIAQNQMSNVQAWRETYIDSGDIAARAELASRAYALIQSIYTSMLEIELIDKALDKSLEELEEKKNVEDVDVSQEINEVKSASHLEAKAHGESIFEAVTEMAEMLPKLRRKDAGIEDILGLSSQKVLDFAKACMPAGAWGTVHKHRLAERVLSKNSTKIHISDAVKLLLFYTKDTPVKLGQAAFRSTDNRPEDFGEFFWENGATSAGNALKAIDRYLPRALHVNEDTVNEVYWVEALCDFVLNEANPYRYAHDAIERDLHIGDVNAQQEQRLALLSHLTINRILPSTPYIREVFPEEGYSDRAILEVNSAPVKRPKVHNKFEAGKRALAKARKAKATQTE